jgi:hypothetical protein
VGLYRPGGNYQVEQPVILDFNGQRWSKQPAPTLTGGQLNGVDCVSRSACVAVGSQVIGESGNSSPLIEELRGTSWSVVTSPSPDFYPTNSNSLQAVSCLSANRCTALGWDAGSGYPEEVMPAEGLVGTASTAGWKVGPLGPLVPTSEQSALGSVVVPSNFFDPFRPSAVSCTTNTCVTVGGGRSFIAHDQTWTSLTTRPHLINSVTCSDGTRCLGVGSGSDDDPTGAYIATLDGSTWHSVTSPNSSASSNTLEAVACSGGRFCVAVGNYLNASESGEFRQGTLVETDSGDGWRLAPSVRTPPQVDDTLSSVSCPSRKTCIAVGSSAVNALHEPTGPVRALSVRVAH